VKHVDGILWINISQADDNISTLMWRERISAELIMDIPDRRDPQMAVK